MKKKERDFKIGFITTGHISSNPRLFKEIKSASEHGYTGEVLYIQTLDLLIEHDDILIEKISNFNFSVINWKKLGLLTRIIEKVLYLSLKSYNPIFFHEFGRQLLKKSPKNVTCLIGHNLGTLPIIYYISQKKNIPFIFDVEDYHPGEFNSKIEYNKRALLMKSILPNATYITYASPLIGQKLRELLGTSGPPMYLINNTFSKHEFIIPFEVDGPVRFVWFSQTISYGRGLELLIESFKNFRKLVKLILIGNKDDKFAEEWINPNIDFIEIYSTMPQEKLHQFLSEFDIGIAFEPSESTENKRICLSNKIWAYLLSGLYIFASNTPGQSLFMQEHSKKGVLVKQNIEDIKFNINIIINNIQEIRKGAKDRFKEAQNYSWEVEQIKWLNIINKLKN